MGSLSSFSSQEQGESQGTKSMQAYHEVCGVQKHFFIYQFVNSDVSREVKSVGVQTSVCVEANVVGSSPRFGRP